MLALAGAILIVLALLGVTWMALVMLADNPGAGATLLVLVACAVAYMIF